MKKGKLLAVIFLITILCTGCTRDKDIQQSMGQSDFGEEYANVIDGETEAELVSGDINGNSAVGGAEDENSTCDSMIIGEVSDESPDYPEAEAVPTGEYDFTLCFAGDINLDEKWCTTQYLNRCENGIADCISPELITYMQEADVMCLNNEFTYSKKEVLLKGKPTPFVPNRNG